MPRMYQVIRTYKNEITESSKDTQTRIYTFYVDRQNIISYFNNNILVGGDIKLNMQPGSEKSKVFGGEQFLQEFVND